MLLPDLAWAVNEARLLAATPAAATARNRDTEFCRPQKQGRGGTRLDAASASRTPPGIGSASIEAPYEGSCRRPQWPAGSRLLAPRQQPTATVAGRPPFACAVDGAFEKKELAGASCSIDHESQLYQQAWASCSK